MPKSKQSVLVWDLPLRLFHWLLAGLLVAAVITANLGGNAMDWHGRIGIAIAGLLAFRIVWGVIGTTHARFASFVRGPATILRYMRGEWHGLGHNPLGALSVLALLSVVTLQVATGLFSNDDIAFSGPLAVMVSKETSDSITALHHSSSWLVGLLVALHIGAIAYYVRIKRENLVKPMLSGRKETTNEFTQPMRGGGLPALLLALAIAGVTAWIAAGGLLPPPPPPAPSIATPEW